MRRFMENIEYASVCVPLNLDQRRDASYTPTCLYPAYSRSWLTPRKDSGLPNFAAWHPIFRQVSKTRQKAHEIARHFTKGWRIWLATNCEASRGTNRPHDHLERFPPVLGSGNALDSSHFQFRVRRDSPTADCRTSAQVNTAMRAKNKANRV